MPPYCTQHNTSHGPHEMWAQTKHTQELTTGLFTKFNITRERLKNNKIERESDTNKPPNSKRVKM